MPCAISCGMRVAVSRRTLLFGSKVSSKRRRKWKSKSLRNKNQVCGSITSWVFREMKEDLKYSQGDYDLYASMTGRLKLSYVALRHDWVRPPYHRTRESELHMHL
jgi:hypothetical protein